MGSSEFSRANELLRHGRLEEAVAAYQSAIAENPTFHIAYHNLGEALEKLEEWEEAVCAYRQALHFNPEAVYSQFNLERILRQLGREEEIVKVREKKVEVDGVPPNFLNVSVLKLGDRTLREQRFGVAMALYFQALKATPGSSNNIASKLATVREKYWEARQNSELKRVAVCGWELAHNPAGRVYTLAQLYQTFAWVEIIGSIFPKYGKALWEPIRNTTIPVHSFVVEDESRFLEQAEQLVAAHPYDIVHLSKPRSPNIFFGILYKFIWGATVFVDIDDEELAFVGCDTSISLEDYLQQYGRLPKLSNLSGPEWTRLAVGLVHEFDGITVSNPALQKRYGGEIIRHARDEKLYNPSPELKRRSREALGIDPDKKVVLFFGTPRKHKGLLEVADAIASLQRDDVVFAIVGDFPDPELKAQLLEKQGVNYFFLGNQPFDRIPEIVAIGDCCVLLQDRSSPVSQFQVPAKLSDALGMGLVILVNYVPSLGDLIKSEAVFAIEQSNLKQELSKCFHEGDVVQKKFNLVRSIFHDKFSKKSNSIRLKQLDRQKNNWHLANNLKRTLFLLFLGGIPISYFY